jgi:hypothetical protein
MKNNKKKTSRRAAERMKNGTGQMITRSKSNDLKSTSQVEKASEKKKGHVITRAMSAASEFTLTSQ